MARPAKTTVEWFPLDCVMNGKTMFTLETRYANDGFTFWIKLLQTLGSTPGHCLNLSDEADVEFLSAKSRLSPSAALEMLDLLATLRAIDQKLWRNCRMIWCQNFVDKVAGTYDKRETDIPRKPELSGVSGETTIVSGETTAFPGVSGVDNSHTTLHNTTSHDKTENSTNSQLSDSPFSDGTFAETEGKGAVNEKTPSKASPIPEGFDEFWDALPRKADRAGSIKCFRTARIRHSLVYIMDATRNFAEAMRAQQRAHEHIRTPSAFLNSHLAGWQSDGDEYQDAQKIIKERTNGQDTRRTTGRRTIAADDGYRKQLADVFRDTGCES